MSKKISILFSSAGRRVALIKCFKDAAKEIGLNNLEIIAVDILPKWSPACQIADASYQVPHCKDESFFDSIIKICNKHSVDFIIPTIDTELYFYATKKEKFKKYGINIIIGEKDFVSFSMDKKKTFEVLKKINIPTPEIYDIESVLKKEIQIKYPAIIKPIYGSASNGFESVSSFEDLKSKNIDKKKYLLQKLCTGKEFTINCFFDKICVSCVPHQRKFIRDGEVCFAETMQVPKFKDVANKLASYFPIYSPLCFQAFLMENNQIEVFEVNARFGGGYPICDKAGGTFARWLLQKASGLKPDYHNNFQENLRMLRYDDAIFI